MPWTIATAATPSRVKTENLGFPVASLRIGGDAPLAEIGSDDILLDLLETEEAAAVPPTFFSGVVSEIALSPSVGYNGETTAIGSAGNNQSAGYPAVSAPVMAIPVAGYSSIDSVSIPKSFGGGYSGGGSWTENLAVEFYEDGTVGYNPEAYGGTVGYPTTNTFAFNPYTQQLVLFFGYVSDEDGTAQPKLPTFYNGIPLQVKGKRALDYVGTTSAIQTLPPRETNLVTKQLPFIFSRFPMNGEFTVSLSFEGQPSGGFAFEVPGNYRNRVECDLRPGKSLSLFGVWFRVQSLNIEERPRREYPGGLIVVSVSLGGYNEEVLGWNVPFRGGTISPGSVPAAKTDKGEEDEDEDDIDPECVLNSDALSADKAARKAVDGNKRNTISLSRIAGKAQFCYQGPSVKVPIPKDATKYDCTNWQQHATEAVRLAGKYLDYNERCVKAQQWGGGRTYRFREDDILSDTVTHSINARDESENSVRVTSYLPPGNDITSDFPASPYPIANPSSRIESQRCFPYGAKYCRVRLDGEFMGKSRSVNRQAEEKTKMKIRENHSPRWKLIPPVRTEIRSGDVFPFSPPIVDPRTEEGLPDISFIGQSQKVESVTINESGAIMEERNTTWGYSGLLSGNVSWGIVEHSVTTYRYDGQTGYLLGNRKDARRWLQLATESPGDRTRDSRWLGSSGGDTYEQQWQAIIAFRWVSLSGGQKIGIVTHSHFYGNIDPPATVEYKHCLRSGKSVMRQQRDPNYVEPAFAEVTIDSSYGMFWRNHPDSEPGAELPPFTTGQRSESRTTIQIDQAVYEKVNRKKEDGSEGSGITNYRDDGKGYTRRNAIFGREIKPDMYTSYTSTESAQGPNFKDFARDSKFSENIGRPGTHTCKPKNFERVPDPEDEDENEDDDKNETKAQYRYYLNSPGCLRRDYCERGSKTYRYATSRANATNAARTELEIDDFKNALKTSCEVAFDPTIRPGNKVSITYNGVTCRRIVDSVKWSLSLQGWENGSPVVTWNPMSLEMGIDRAGGMSMSLRREKDPDADNKKSDPTTDKDDNNDDGQRLDPLRNDKFRITWNGQREG